MSNGNGRQHSYSINGFEVDITRIQSIITATGKIFVNFDAGVHFTVTPAAGIALIRHMQKIVPTHLGHILGNGVVTIIQNKMARGEYPPE